jgi:anthraniloyl-CoA monooxygenase
VFNEAWRHENVVLIGDAAHTAHFSIGSGTKLAMEDAISLSRALRERRDLREAVAAYEAERRPLLSSMQKMAEVSQRWFESTERFASLQPMQLAFNLITRAMRVPHENLKLRDAAFVDRFNRWFAGASPSAATPPPMFAPYRLRGLELENRIVVSPMCQFSAEDGVAGEWHVVHLGSRAIGGAGLVIAEMTDVSAEGRISPRCTGLYRAEHAAAWRRVVDFVHRRSTAKIGVQLGHAGRKSEGDWETIAPSPLPWQPGWRVPREMTREDLARVKSEFVRATSLAEEAGFDLIELHFAHGYLLASFLSPLTNRRTDEYGGSLSNRLRFPLEVLDAVRATWPKDQPISVRISAVDWVPEGNSIEDAIVISRALKEHGADIVCVSAGNTTPEGKPQYGKLYQAPFAERIRMEANVPVMIVGGISAWTDVNSILALGRADLCALARAHLFDPYWTRHAANDQGWALSWPPQYESVQRYTVRFK